MAGHAVEAKLRNSLCVVIQGAAENAELAVSAQLTKIHSSTCSSLAHRTLCSCSVLKRQ